MSASTSLPASSAAGPDAASAASSSASSSAADAASQSFLKSLIGSTLRITASDGRIFAGEFKCTDNECNVILARTHEYRAPSAEAVARAAEKAEGSSAESVKLDMTSRFMGLVVVPGKHIAKIELEERRWGP